jgi:hypothetical protein
MQNRTERMEQELDHEWERRFEHTRSELAEAHQGDP